MNQEIQQALRAPFAATEVGKLPKVTCRKCSDKNETCTEHRCQKCKTCKGFLTTAHLHIDYVGHAHVTERLLDVDPSWTWEPFAIGPDGLPATDPNGGLWIRLTVAGQTRLGYGHASGKRGGDAIKEVIGDAIRNAAMRFGVALDLWKKETPAPVEDVPSREVERPVMTEDDRKKQLRGQIATIGKSQGKTIDQIGAEFHDWSRGTEIGRASETLLIEFKDYLTRPLSGDRDE
jgi:hypothetical protein